MENKTSDSTKYGLPGFYLILILVLLGFAFLGTPDDLSGLGLVVATLPWSYLAGILLTDSNSGWTGDGSAISAAVFFFLLSLPNAALLYFGGLFIDRFRGREPRVP
jgi:hypothetical protein